MTATSPLVRTSRNRGPGVSLTATWLSPAAAVISVHGDLDAASAPEFSGYANRHARCTDKLVLDLSGIDFFGTSGLAALHDLDAQCVANNVVWGLTSCRAVDRVVEVCGAELPIYPTVTAALNAVRRRSTRSVQLIT